MSHAKVDADYTEKLNQMTDNTYSAGDLVGPAQLSSICRCKKRKRLVVAAVKIAGQQKVIDAAFSEDLLDSGKNSQVIELSADRSVVVRRGGAPTAKT
ncbi:MAG: hypothetical protein R3E67_01765 [Pseudomonadales bacterium]